jgi:carbonic anhydrase
MNMNVTTITTDQQAKPAHTTEALVLSCMDHRLVGHVADYLEGRRLRGRYDQISLAGGAIGVMSDQTAAWAETFWQHVELARDLHGIRRVIVIDHRDCGACKAFVCKTCADERARETQIHIDWMTALAQAIKPRAPDLEVELLLMDLDGSVEVIAEPETPKRGS